MRHLTIIADPSSADAIVDRAFSAGADAVLRSGRDRLSPGGGSEQRLVLEVHLPAPQARRFVDSLAGLPDARWSLVSVKPRALRGGTPLREETRPYPVPGLEVEEDLWEFAHVTGSLVLRVLLAALLVAYGMMEANLPVMIAGLLFLPYHHALLAVALGVLRRRWTLVAQGAGVFGLTTLLIAAAVRRRRWSWGVNRAGRRKAAAQARWSSEGWSDWRQGLPPRMTPGGAN